MKWTEDDESLLIDFVRENPIIFDNKIGDGNRMESIRQLYSDFAKYAYDGRCDGNELRGRWQKLRTYYIQLSRAKPQMDYEGKIMKWKHYPNMSFLAVYVAKEIAKGQGGVIKQELQQRAGNFETNEHMASFTGQPEFILPEEDSSHLHHSINHIENMNNMIPIIKLEEEDDAPNYCSVTINNVDEDSRNEDTNQDDQEQQYSESSNGNINEPEVVMVTDQGEEVPLPGLKRGRGRPPRRNLPEITFSSFKAASSSTPAMTRARETEITFQKIHHVEQKKPRGRPRLSGNDMAATPKWKISNVQSLQNDQPASSSSHYSEPPSKRMCFPNKNTSMQMQPTIPQNYMPHISNMHPNMPTSTSNEVQVSERESDHMSKILLSLLGRVENPFRRTECFIQMLQIAKSYLQD